MVARCFLVVFDDVLTFDALSLCACAFHVLLVSHPKPFPCRITLRSQESAELIKAGTALL